MLGGGTAAATHDIDQALCGKLVNQAAGDIWCLIKTCVTHGVGQARVGVAADVRARGHF